LLKTFLVNSLEERKIASIHRLQSATYNKMTHRNRTASWMVQRKEVTIWQSSG